MVNGFHYLMGAVYCTPCDFASVEGFAALIEPRFSDLPFDRQPVVERTESVIAEFERPTGQVDTEKALLLLAARDLRRARDIISSQPINDPNTTLPTNRDRYEGLLRQLGLQFSPPRLFIVDTFPKPYDTMNWTATSPDRADQENYGIEPGNYFKRSRLIPFRSDFLLAHEMIHQIIGEVDPYLLGRGLEEGIAVIFGELFIGAQVLGSGLAHLYAGYHWFDRRTSQGNKLYAEYARMAAIIYQLHGLDGLIAVIQGGREKIKHVEQAYLAGDFDVDLPSGRWEDWYTKLLRQVTMATIDNLVVSPLARYLAPHATVGTTCAQISEATRVLPEDVTTALEELQHNTVVVMLDEDRVAYSDASLLLPSHALRYDV
jgi:hypothetical protein